MNGHLKSLQAPAAMHLSRSVILTRHLPWALCSHDIDIIFCALGTMSPLQKDVGFGTCLNQTVSLAQLGIRQNPWVLSASSGAYAVSVLVT